MQANTQWKNLGWRHVLWDLVRYYFSLRGKKRQREWLDRLNSTGQPNVGESTFAVDSENVKLLRQYLKERGELFDAAFGYLRSEEEALAFCEANKVGVQKTRTQSTDHHQSSKALVASVSHTALKVCSSLGITLEDNPQRRCVWCSDHALHVTARNLDGAIPALMDPAVIWEIKEYWGKTSGGSKMSDAVYECHLVGRELREFEERSDISVKHIVFVDGKEQWGKRKSDLARFIDLMNQGFIDYFFVGTEIESDWELSLRAILE